MFPIYAFGSMNYKEVSFEEYQLQLEGLLQTRPPVEAVEIYEVYRKVRWFYQEPCLANYYRLFSAWKSAHSWLPDFFNWDLNKRITGIHTYQDKDSDLESAFDAIRYFTSVCFTTSEVDGHDHMDEARSVLFFSSPEFAEKARQARLEVFELENLFRRAFKNLVFRNETPYGDPSS